MNLKQLINKYLNDSMVLQIATSVDNIPWVCTVCFAYDSRFNLYWFSRHATRHSQEIVRNPHVAGAVSVRYALGDKPRGLQLIGTALELSDETSLLSGITALRKRYHVPFERVKQLKKELRSQTANYGLYSLRPDSIVVYDTFTFPDSPRQEYKVFRNVAGK